MASGAILQQALYAVATLGVADLLETGLRTSSELAARLSVNEPALLRVMRLLASEGVFDEAAPAVFTNNAVSHLLRSAVPGSLRSFVVMRGSHLFFTPFAEILYSIETGLSARRKTGGKSSFELLSENHEMARIFDDAMTNLSEWLGPAIAASYDFGAWGSLMDVGGGNGMLLGTILKAHPQLRGVLADLPAVIERAEQRALLAGDLKQRCALRSCDFFQEVPAGCRAYLMKNVIHDWDDERALKILMNCRRAVPDDGALLLAQWAVSGAHSSWAGRFMDIAMMVLTGGKERDVDEYRELLSRAGFRLNQVFPVPGDFSVIEALPL
jgi:hypothetical protein